MFLKSLTIAAVIAVTASSVPLAGTSFAREAGGGNGGGSSASSSGGGGQGGHGGGGVDIVARVPSSLVIGPNRQPELPPYARFDRRVPKDSCPPLTHPSSLSGCPTQ
jgi:hypothetical protein